MVSVILMMAGSSSRMNCNENKLFMKLGEKEVFKHSLDLFLSYDVEVICVVKKEYINYLSSYNEKIKIVIGGETRQQSVFNGITAASNDYILIHDAARPFVSKKIIGECFKAIDEKTNFMVVQPSKDSIYVKSPLTNIDRNNICLAQTPQGGNKSDFLNAHILAKNDGFVGTDDISILLKYFNKEIKIIEGEDTNFKITTQLDYILAKELIKND